MVRRSDASIRPHLIEQYNTTVRKNAEAAIHLNQNASVSIKSRCSGPESGWKTRNAHRPAIARYFLHSTFERCLSFAHKLSRYFDFSVLIPIARRGRTINHIGKNDHSIIND